MAAALFVAPLPLAAAAFAASRNSAPRRPAFPPLRHAAPRRTTGPRMDTADPGLLGEQLVRAAMQSDLPALTSLLSLGASPSYPSAKNDSQMTALMWAASEGDVPIASALLSAGAEPNARNRQNLTALLYAFENLPSANPRPAPPPGFPGSKRPGPPPPQRKIEPRVTGHASVAKLLLVAGADPKVTNAFGETLLHLAARKAQMSWVDVLVTAGVDVNAKSVGYLETAMHIAAKEGHADFLRELKTFGAVVDAKNRYGWSPLVWAAACANVDAVKALLELAADPNLTTFSGEGVEATTPLREARKSGRPEEVSKLLIRAGAIE